MADFVLVSLAPAAAELGHLLRAAIDAEQVGAGRVHLAADQPEPAAALAGLREHTRLLVTSSAPLAGADEIDWLAEELVDEAAPVELVARVTELVRAHPAGVSVGGRGGAAVPVLLAALAAGAHLRVGTADAPPAELRGGGRDDAALVARAAGLARIAGRVTLTADQVRRPT
jgi:hypothetical protein